MMDTSETYVKMCDCPEIQVQRPKGDYWRDWGEDGDFVWVRHDDDPLDSRFHAGPSIVWNGCLPTTGYHNWREMWADARDSDVIWLPRQDQLQEMVGDPMSLITGNIDNFYTGGWRDEAWGHEDWEEPRTMEQLWLMYVMYHKHNKHWNGSEWVQ